MYKELLGEELNEKIKAVLKEKNMTLLIDNPAQPAFIPKSRFDEVIQKKNELKTQASELSGQLEDLKKAAKGNEKLTAQIEELQNKNSEWEKKYNNSAIESAVKYKGLSEKAKDPADLLKFLDLSKLQIDETGNIKGLEEQLNSVKQSKPYLFSDTETKSQVPTSGGINPSSGLPKPNNLQAQYDEICNELTKNPYNRDLLAQRFKLKEQLK